MKVQDRMFSGVFSAKEALARGMPRHKLAQLVAQGEVSRLSRGVYVPKQGNPSSLLEIETLIKKGVDFVLALESALYLHHFANATPHVIWIALKRGARCPKVDFPLEIVRVDERSRLYGVEDRVIEGVPLRVYSAAKTVADLFKFRNRTGLELAIGALKEGLREKRFTVDELMKAADANRVRRVIIPYVEGYFG